MAFVDTLTEFGFGGGYDDPNPLHATSDAFKWNTGGAVNDLCGNGGIMRANYTFDPDGSSPNTAQIDHLVAIAAATGCQVLLSVNVRSPTSPSRVPVINSSGVMQGYKNAFKAALDRYAGPNAVIKAGSTVKLDASAGGVTITIPSTWRGVKWWECWNEPQSIGSCGGALMPNNVNSGSQGRPWYEVVYILNRDFADVADAHPARSSFQVAAFDIGGLEWGYLFGTTSGTTQAPVPFGTSKGFSWNRFDAFSMHCYVVRDPLSDNPTSGPRGNLNTLATHMRPRMNQNGADQCEIWLTEGGHAGSLQLSNNTEYRNRFNPDYSGTDHWKDISWGHAWSDSGKDAAQQASDETHPQVMTGYMTKIRQMNVSSGTKVRMVTPHMLVRSANLSAVQGNPTNAWHQGRCMVDPMPTDPKTNKNAYTRATGSGTGKSSPDWLPAGKAWYLTRIGGGPTLSAPTIQSGSSPAISDTTPVVGQTLRADEGQWNGNPAPSFLDEWLRDGTTVIATGNSYDVTAADLGHTLTLRVTASNSQGTATPVSSSATAAVGPGGTGTPSMVTRPGLTTLGAAVSAANPPHVGVEVDTSDGTYSPAATSYQYAWEKQAPDGTITTI